MAGSPSSLPLGEGLAAVLNRALKLEGFFPEFTAEHARRLFPRSGLYAYPKETHLIDQGEPGRDLFVIYKGKVVVYRAEGKQLDMLAMLDPGDILGEIGLVKDGIRTATAKAAEESEIYRLVYEDIQYLLKNNADLAEHLKALAAQRLGKH